MKRIILSFFAALIFIGCSNDSEFINDTINKVTALPSTEVYVAGSKVTTFTDENVPMSRAGSYTGETYDNAYFFVRVDNRIPEITATYTSSKYYPQTVKSKTKYSDLNKGSIKKSYPFNYLGTRGVWNYVYDPTGRATVEAIASELPTIDDLLNANEVDMAEHFKNMDRSKVKLMWYVVKYQPGDYDAEQGINSGQWHIDGVLTLDTTTDVTKIPGLIIAEDAYMTKSEPISIDGYVKVDIHQQAHKDWEAIKTTIHIGATVDDVTVKIPIDKNDIAEKDDFAIRTYDAYYTINADASVFQKVIAAEYKESDAVKVISLDDFKGTRRTEDDYAVNEAKGEVFVVEKDNVIKRMFYVLDNNLYEYSYGNANWQPSNKFTIKVRVAHEENHIAITVKDISPDIIEAQKLVNPDGLTVEVWSYPRLAKEGENVNDYRKAVYEKLQNAEVEVGFNQPLYSTDKNTPAADGKYYTTVSSAFFE